MPTPPIKPAKDLPTVRLWLIAAGTIIWICFCIGVTVGYIMGRVV